MCLALPSLVIQRLENDQAVISLGGVQQTISVALTPEAQPGDYVIVHVGHAIGMLNQAEAEETLALFASDGLATGAGS